MAVYPVRIQIVAVGKLRQVFWRAAAVEYLGRVQHYAAVEVVETRDCLGRGRSAAETLAEETRRIMRCLRPEALVVLLARNGRQYSSEQLAKVLAREMDAGRRLWQFVVGGPAGIAESLINRADLRLSLSAMTLPHDMARVVLLEQLYRVFTILRGQKYHK